VNPVTLTTPSGAPAGTVDEDGYRYVRLTLTPGGRAILIRSHRVIWALVTGKWPKHDLDHHDRDPGNNRFENLREATNGQNRQNEDLSSRNTSGVKGVRWHKLAEKWQARIDRLHLGLFDTFRDACIARFDAEIAHHPFRAMPKPLDPMKIIPDGVMVTGVWKVASKRAE
jgi:hypothetical protein